VSLKNCVGNATLQLENVAQLFDEMHQIIRPHLRDFMPALTSAGGINLLVLADFSTDFEGIFVNAGLSTRAPKRKLVAAVSFRWFSC
jgi:hypothetical protein